MRGSARGQLLGQRHPRPGPASSRSVPGQDQRHPARSPAPTSVIPLGPRPGIRTRPIAFPCRLPAQHRLVEPEPAHLPHRQVPHHPPCSGGLLVRPRDDPFHVWRECAVRNRPAAFRPKPTGATGSRVPLPTRSRSNQNQPTNRPSASSAAQTPKPGAGGRDLCRSASTTREVGSGSSTHHSGIGVQHDERVHVCRSSAETAGDPCRATAPPSHHAPWASLARCVGGLPEMPVRPSLAVRRPPTTRHRSPLHRSRVLSHRSMQRRLSWSLRLPERRRRLERLLGQRRQDPPVTARTARPAGALPVPANPRLAEPPAPPRPPRVTPASSDWSGCSPVSLIQNRSLRRSPLGPRTEPHRNEPSRQDRGSGSPPGTGVRLAVSPDPVVPSPKSQA